MSTNVAGREHCRIEPYDLVIHAVDPGLALSHQLRLKASVSVARNINREKPIITLQRLVHRTIATVGFIIYQLGLRLAAQIY